MIEENEYYYNWLEDALDLDIHIGSMNDEVQTATDFLFKEVSNIFESQRAKARTKEALKIILLNLWIADRQNMPVKYSRNPNDYSRPKRYGRLFFKYDRTVNIIDALEEMGYIKQLLGYYDRTKNIGRQTRIYATNKLKDLFQGYDITEPGFIYKDEPEEIIQFKDDRKKLKNYPESDLTRSMRANLTEYNTFIRSHDIRISLDSQTMIDARFLNDLYSSHLKGVIEPSSLRVAYVISREDSSDISDVCMTTPPYSSPIETCIPSLYIPTITNKIRELSNQSIVIEYSNKEAIRFLYQHIPTITNKIREIDDKTKQQQEWQRKRCLSDFGIEGLTLRIRYESLHRVFNRESFEHGGRFYGAYHLSIPKQIRPMIHMNGEPTVELDFSALHIRMLYHLKGIDYRQDPYAILCESKEERKLYKLVQLISINAEDERRAIQAIRDEFRKNEIRYPLTDNAIRILLKRFKEVHQPIAEYLSTGIGLTLQNLDSAITEDILIGFMREGIPCLPVHDSYIVPARYKDRLYHKMMEAYEKMMGFEPVID